jgi:LacI family transcriptional regulator
VTGRRAGFRPPISSALSVPVVYAFLASADPQDCSVVPDEAGGTRLAVEHLLSVGRRRIAHITGPEHHDSARIRARSISAELVAAPLYGRWTEAWGRHGVGILLAQDVDFDAVVCGSDQIARGVCDALREAGRSVPQDVAVTGFDNWDVIALASRPPLTSVDMDLEGLGRRAARLLLTAIAGERSPGVHEHPARLVIRDSTVSG